VGRAFSSWKTSTTPDSHSETLNISGLPRGSKQASNSYTPAPGAILTPTTLVIPHRTRADDGAYEYVGCPNPRC
jgi:hypothetical protein